MSAAPAASAKAELGSEDAVVGTGGDANDEAASSPLGTAAQPGSGAAARQPDSDGAAPAGEAADGKAGPKAEEHSPPADAPASAASAEGSSGLPPVSSAAQGGAAGGGFSFGGNLAKSVGGFGGGSGSGFGALAGVVSRVPWCGRRPTLSSVPSRHVCSRLAPADAGSTCWVQAQPAAQAALQLSARGPARRRQTLAPAAYSAASRLSLLAPRRMQMPRPQHKACSAALAQVRASLAGTILGSLRSPPLAIYQA